MPEPNLMQSVGAVGYLGTSLLFGLLTLLMLAAWIRHRAGGLWVVACFFSTVWALVLSLQSAGFPFRPEFVFIIEICRIGAWLAFLAFLLGRLGGESWLKWLALVSFPAVMAAGLLLGNDTVPSRADAITYGGLGLALLGLVLLEQIYRNASLSGRASLTPLVIGVGGLFAFDLFLYSQAVLFSSLDATSWLARGAANVVFVPIIALAARRSPAWSLDIFVSRQVVFYSSTLVAVGIYLILMSIGGYLLIRLGGNWGGVARIVFFVGAIAVLFALLFSSSLRARSRVFLSKHFFRNKYDYREEWLRLVNTLSELGEKSTRENAIKSISQIVESPAGALWILDPTSESYPLVASRGDVPKMPDLDDGDALVAFMSRDGWLVDLKEYRENPSVYGGLVLPQWLDDAEGAWLAVPLMLQQRLYGLILLVEAAHAPALNFEDRDLLKTVGSHVAVHLAQERSDELLAEAQQFEAFNRLTAFLMHDLNNLIAQQSLIVANSEKHKRNPEFVDDAMTTISASVQRMKRVMAQLKRSESREVRNTAQLKHLASAAADRCQAAQPVPELRDNGVEASVAVDTEQCLMVLTHLIKNAQDATPDDGEVAVELADSGESVSISIVDNGEGMSAQFIRDRLFRPFDSTKGARGMGIGAYQAREFARNAGGELAVTSTPGVTTTVTLRLPKTRN